MRSTDSVQRVIEVAGGKLDVIRAALYGKLVHVLVTDEGVAARLLESV